ncbi:MAG: sigma-70 family RNA polymerase sigma factor [Isosphaerales bacterium]
MASLRSNAVLSGQLGTLYALGAVGSLTDSLLLERFLAREDPEESDAAFAALVERHGPMVLGVCRQGLPGFHDAHDAFQATFLVLVRRARSIQGRGSLAGWLFGIARRVAARARVEAARRQRHLQKLQHRYRAVHDAAEAPFPGEPEVDYRPLFEAIDALPDRFRSPVVLHYFEGLSTEAIALRLGCPRGTVLSRLDRARRRLRVRLESRGVSLAASLPLVGGTTRLLLDSPVPPSLFQATVRAGCCSGMAGAAIKNVVPAVVANLSRHVARGLTLAKVRMASLVILLASACAAVGFVTGAQALDKSERRAVDGTDVTSPPPPVQTASTTKIARKETSGTVVIRGRVVGPDGKPVKDAQVVLSLPLPSTSEIRSCEPVARSGPDGRFQATVLRERLEQLEQLAVGRLEPTYGPILGAIVPGFAIDWIKADLKSVERGELTIAVGSDDVPIEGRINSLEGRPVAGLTVRVTSVVAVLPGFLEKLRSNEWQMNRAMRDVMRDGISLGERGPIPPVTTDREGRFRLSGIGRDRLALLFIEGGSIERSEALVFTTSDPGFKPTSPPGKVSRAFPLVGPRFEMSVAPGRAVEGVVRDADTQQPIAGAKVVLYGIGLTAATDGRGRFRINGQPRSQLNMPNLVGAEVDGQPYVKVVKPAGDPKGLELVQTEIELKRGAWVEGRVVDRTTGKPVQAIVEYCPFGDNPHLEEYAGASFLDHNAGDEPEFPTDAQGRFRAVALPGGGVLGVRTVDASYSAAEPLAPQSAGRLLRFPSFRQSDRFQALLPIEVTGRESLAIPDIKVARGRTIQVRILGDE